MCSGIKNDGVWLFVMWDMGYVNNGYCGLSKSTQSDGLISDTSTEGFTSSSSTENLREVKSIEKTVATEIEGKRNESQDSIHLIPSTGLHQMKSQCRLYIRWGVLISFGILLWVALWITDIFNPNPFLKEGWLVDVATPKKVTLKDGMMKKPVPCPWWFFNLWSYAFDSIISVTAVEILVVLCCAIILVCREAHMRNKWGGAIEKLWYEWGRRFLNLLYKRDQAIFEWFKNLHSQLCRSLFNIGAEQNEADKVLASKEPEIKSSRADLSIFSHGDVSNLMKQDGAKVKPKLGQKCMQYLNQGQALSIENRISKSLKSSHNMNNTRKRSLEVNGVKNYCNYSCRSNNPSQDITTSELILKKPNFDLSCLSSTSKNDKTKRITEHSNLACSIFNKSTSFVSEEIETWFELPNSEQAEDVMHSFDMQLEEFSQTRSSSSQQSFEEAAQDLQRFSNSSIGCNCEKRSEGVILDDDYNGGIISSSPAFRRFLVNLAKDRLSEPYL